MADNGRAPSGQALAVPVEPVSRLDPTGFDPSRVAAMPWRAMADFPHDGTICAVMFYPWRVKTNDPRIQFAQWLDPYGTGGKLYEPWNMNNEPFADGWLPLDELASLNAIATAVRMERDALAARPKARARAVRHRQKEV